MQEDYSVLARHIQLILTTLLSVFYELVKEFEENRIIIIFDSLSGIDQTLS